MVVVSLNASCHQRARPTLGDAALPVCCPRPRRRAWLVLGTAILVARVPDSRLRRLPQERVAKRVFERVAEEYLLDAFDVSRGGATFVVVKAPLLSSRGLLGLLSAGVGAAAGFLAGKKLSAPRKRIEDIDDKLEMVKFLKKACSSKKTAEYKELYRFLLNVFRRADRDFDGLVQSEDFDLMVEMAGAVPRKFAFAPTSKESFATDEQRVDYRKKAFAKIDADGSGAISFDEWLNYSYQHICQMVATLDEKKADLGMDTKERFKEWCVKASRDRRSAEYKELYDLLLATFVEGDRDQDGRVNATEFDIMIEAAAAYPRRFGYAPPASKTYKTIADRIAARTKMFKDMDTDGNGTITFEEWLTFAYKHICSKAAELDKTLTGVPPAFVAGGDGHPAASCPYGFGR